jgi:hypothetical protein
MLDVMVCFVSEPSSIPINGFASTVEQDRKELSNIGGRPLIELSIGSFYNANSMLADSRKLMQLNSMKLFVFRGELSWFQVG